VNLVIEEMETSNNLAACFKILRYICNTRKYRPLTLLGADDKTTIVNEGVLRTMVQDYYVKIFNQHPFTPSKHCLDPPVPITKQEVAAATKSLKNGRATGIRLNFSSMVDLHCTGT
jgi:hypothetical protein